MTTAVFVSTTELRCNVDLDPEGSILVAYNGNLKTTVIVLPQVGKDGKDYEGLANDQPDTIPFETGFPVGKSLQYAYIETACGDGVKAVNEIGVDCGLAACGKKCEWSNDEGGVENDEACDVKGDCKSNYCNADGVCAFGLFSCFNILQSDENAEDGLFTIKVDKNWRDFTKTVEVDTDIGDVEVRCRFYDGQAYTLYEMICANIDDAGKELPFSPRCATCVLNIEIVTFGMHQACSSSARVVRMRIS
jgi:hypothetical protein